MKNKQMRPPLSNSPFFLRGRYCPEKSTAFRMVLCAFLSLLLIGLCSFFLLRPYFIVSPPSAPLLFERPNFSAPLSFEGQEEPPADPGYIYEYTPRGLLRFQTETAGSAAFGTPVPEFLPYDPRPFFAAGVK